ncbi:hypothetical protein CEE35_06090 [Candidatus Aerophobetes bacterium Ae_b3b]|nr:MAG: hypothetical protein CEE35_06090 [Candidatus Aerophobetes bacterium Ae_b3b]
MHLGARRFKCKAVYCDGKDRYLLDKAEKRRWLNFWHIFCSLLGVTLGEKLAKIRENDAEVFSK